MNVKYVTPHQQLLREGTDDEETSDRLRIGLLGRNERRSDSRSGILSSDLGLPAEPAQGPVSRKAIFPRGEDTLVMMVCRKDASWRCELQEQIVEGLDMHPGTAFMQAQPLVQRWAESHPGYVVRHWRLRPGRGT